MNFTKDGLWFLEQQNSETFFGGLHHARLSASVSLTSDDLFRFSQYSSEGFVELVLLRNGGSLVMDSALS